MRHRGRYHMCWVTAHERGAGALTTARQWTGLRTLGQGAWQPTQSGLITGGADLLCDGRRARDCHLDAARPDQSTSPATTPFERDACRRSSLRSSQPPEAI